MEGDKYKQINDFIKRVIEPAKKELAQKAPYSFEYKINKQGRKFHSITFHPYKIPGNKDFDLEKSDLQKQLSPRWILSSQVLKYLETEYGFKTKEITQWYDLFKEAQQKIDLMVFLSEKKRYALSVKNPKGYLISCLKKELKKQPSTDVTQTELDLFFDGFNAHNSDDLSPEEAKKLVEEIFRDK